MTFKQLEQLLQDIQRLRIAVIGDYCLDGYWFVDPSRSQPSLETGKATSPVSEQRYSPGGAGNVISCLRAIGCGKLDALGVLGQDPWGRELSRLLEADGVNTTAFLRQEHNWSTLAYIKPHIRGEEQSRLDFGNFNGISAQNAAALLNHLEALLPDLDAVIINQQVAEGIHSEAFRVGLGRLVERNPEKLFVADCRDYPDLYRGSVIKVNEAEAARLAGLGSEAKADVLRNAVEEVCRRMNERTGRPVFVTLGSRGILFFHEGELQRVSALMVPGPLDTVGAGDSVVAGITSALAAGRPPAEAAQLGILMASVTIRKLHVTGSASPEEVLQAAETFQEERP